MLFSARTDLAVEAREMFYENSAIDEEIEGVEAEEEDFGSGIKVTRVRISSESGSKSLGKDMGSYITIEIPEETRREQTVYEEACKACANELSGLIKKRTKAPVLVVGLGNWNITADSLGPKTVKSVLVTRHLIEYMPEEIDSRLRSVCAVSPGVLGLTGVETGEIIRGLPDRVNPSLIIVIDALCSRRMERINNTIQLTDAGIIPGAGVGNRRMAIDEKNLGVPVIAIGVPTVVDAATIVSDTVDMLIAELKHNAGEERPIYKVLDAIAHEDKYTMIKQLISPARGDFVVTPKEIDTAVDEISDIIANGINIALHEGITPEDIDRYK